jgi:hypothetical protein
MRTLALPFAIALAGPAAAAPTAAIDPKAAYVLIEIGQLENALLKGTKQPGTLTIARYDPMKGDVRGGQLSPDSSLGQKVSPRILIASKPLAKSKTSRQYLLKVEPDTWVIEGASGTAFSLASNSFRIEPGQIVDLGVVKPVVEYLEGEGPKGMMGGIMGAALFGSMKPKESRPVRIDWKPRGAADLPIPLSLNGRDVTPVQFTYGAKFGNYLGGLVNRIDGRAGREHPSDTPPAAVKPGAFIPGTEPK